MKAPAILFALVVVFSTIVPGTHRQGRASYGRFQCSPHGDITSHLEQPAKRERELSRVLGYDSRRFSLSSQAMARRTLPRPPAPRMSPGQLHLLPGKLPVDRPILRGFPTHVEIHTSPHREPLATGAGGRLSSDSSYGARGPKLRSHGVARA